MNLLKFESELTNKEDIKAMKKALKKFKKTSVVLKVELDDFMDIFNKYLIDELDINLYEYDIAIEKNPLIIKLDMTFVKDESLEEYKYIIKELRNHFGKSIVKVYEDDENTMGVINIKSALRMMFSEASELEQIDDFIKIKINLEEIKENSFEKYFLE